MNSKQANKVKHLAADVNKVLEGLEWECKECNVTGYVGVTAKGCGSMKCPTCKGKGILSYSWQPQVGDKVCRGNMILFYAGIIPAIDGKRAGRFISDAGTDYEWPIDIVTYIPEWEVVEEVLEKEGWFRFKFSEWANGEVRATATKRFSKYLIAATAKSRQEAVMLAVIKLGKELKT